MPPQRHWRSYGTDPLPTPAEDLAEPFAAFQSWFLRIECDRCGKVVMHNEAHMSERQRGIVLRVLLSRMRHDGCGGRAGKVELLTGVDGASSRPVRRICAAGLTGPSAGSEPVWAGLSRICSASIPMLHSGD
jgi:hypothetical protein